LVSERTESLCYSLRVLAGYQQQTKGRNLFRKAGSGDIDALHELLIAQAVKGEIEPRFAEEAYRSGLRRNLNNIRKQGRRLDEDVRAQLLVWEKDGENAGFLINSAILPNAGNEIWLTAVLPAFSDQDLDSEMTKAALGYLHPRVDVFVRCHPAAQATYDMYQRQGFLLLETTDEGARVLKLPKLGSELIAQGGTHQQLEPFVEIPLQKS
jgi:hypothetical protein